MEPALIARVEFFANYSFLHSTELICLEKLMIGGKNFIIFINFWVCEKQFILGLFLAFFGFLSAPYCIHWPFLGLDHFHNLLLSEPVEEIGFICPNNHFFLILKRFCHFWSFLVITSISTEPVLVSRVEFFAVISPLHSIEPIWVEKWPLC